VHEDLLTRNEASLNFRWTNYFKKIPDAEFDAAVSKKGKH
jgi:hypothetical protein